jgi:hypothetical protein
LESALIGEEMDPDRKPQMYWLDEWEGKARGGYYVRSDVVQSIKKLEKTGLKVVGIEFDGTFNLHLITEVPESN